MGREGWTIDEVGTASYESENHRIEITCSRVSWQLLQVELLLPRDRGEREASSQAFLKRSTV